MAREAVLQGVRAMVDHVLEVLKSCSLLSGLPEAALHLESGPQPTRDSLDRMSRADVLIGGGGVTSSFFVLAAHLCDACVV